MNKVIAKMLDALSTEELTKVKSIIDSIQQKRHLKSQVSAKNVYEIPLKYMKSIKQSSCIYDSLMTMGVDTIGKLSEMTYYDLFKIRNMGRKRIQYIREELEEDYSIVAFEES